MSSKLGQVILTLFFLLGSNYTLAANFPAGNISIHNASNKNVTAKVSAFGQFNLSANERKSVPYSTLAQVCSDHLTRCTAQFYVDNKPVGMAIIDVTTGKLISKQLTIKVHTINEQKVLRSVVII